MTHLQPRVFQLHPIALQFFRLCLGCARQSTAVSWCPVHLNQELDQTVPPFCPMCLSFLPIGNTVLCKWEGRGTYYITRYLMWYHGQVTRLAPEASKLLWIFQHGQQWGFNTSYSNYRITEIAEVQILPIIASTTT